VWIFFARGHGKGEVDGARAFLKCEIKKEQLKLVGRKLYNKNEVVVSLGMNVTSTMLHMLMLKHTLTNFSMKLKWEMLINLNYLDATQ
jgi:hypothetical protein